MAIGHAREMTYIVDVHQYYTQNEQHYRNAVHDEYCGNNAEPMTPNKLDLVESRQESIVGKQPYENRPCYR